MTWCHRPSGSNWPRRGCKGTYFEGGVAVPAFVYSPALIGVGRRGARYAGLVHHVDWLPTLARLAGRDLDAAALGLDGLDLWDEISIGAPATAAAASANRTLVFDLSDERGFVLRVGDLKYMTSEPRAGWYLPPVAHADDDGGAWTNASARNATVAACTNTSAPGAAWLFNVTADPTESVNLIAVGAYASHARAIAAEAARRYDTEYVARFFPYGGALSRYVRRVFMEHDQFVYPWGCPEIW